MVWKGGFSGVGFTREELKKWLSGQKKPVFAKFLVAHNTAAPYIRPSVAPSSRIANLANYYKNQKKWSSGPHGFIIVDKFYPGTPSHEIGTHSPGWNGISLGFECEGDYRTGKHDPKTGDGGKAWDTMAWVFAEYLAWLGWEPNGDRIKLHREDNKTTHACPGNLVEKDWFIEKVALAMGKALPPKPVPVVAAKPTNLAKPAVKQLFDVRTIQERLIVHGYDPGPVDGLMGPKTKAGIMAMQEKLRITPSGLVGPWMWEQLQKAPPAQPVPKQPDPLPTPAIPDVVVKPQPVPIVAPGQPEPNPAKAMRLLQTVALWPRHWAAGAVAQAQRESYPDLRPWAQGDWMLNGEWVKKGTPGAKATAFGIWQLREDRYDNYLSFATARGKPWDDFETQVLWCPQELKTSEKLAWKWLQRAENVTQANAAMVWYERPKGYISSRAKAATTWDEVFAVSEQCDGYDVRLKFAKALM